MDFADQVRFCGADTEPETPTTCPKCDTELEYTGEDDEADAFCPTCNERKPLPGTREYYEACYDNFH